MELGLGRVLEMFEERFGKTASTILLGFVGVAIVSVSLEAVGGLFSELYDAILYVRGHENIYELLKDRFGSLFIATLIAITLIFCAIKLAVYGFNRKTSDLMQQTKKHYEKYTKLTDDNMKKAVSDFKDIQEGMARFNEESKEVYERTVASCKELIDDTEKEAKDILENAISEAKRITEEAKKNPIRQSTSQNDSQ